jgi:hypothetical protein
MGSIKIIGKAKISNGLKVLVPAPITYNIWDFFAPIDGSSISNFEIGYDSGTLLADWGAGFQSINSDEPINFII